MGRIVNHRILGTRVTVWDILHHLDGHWTIPEIAEVFGITPEDVQAAIGYIAQHEAEVRQVDREIAERNARGNPAEVEAKLLQARAKRLAWLTERRKEQAPEVCRVGNRA